jgi:hypothetical protein
MPRTDVKGKRTLNNLTDDAARRRGGQSQPPLSPQLKRARYRLKPMSVGTWTSSSPESPSSASRAMRVVKHNTGDFGDFVDLTSVSESLAASSQARHAQARHAQAFGSSHAHTRQLQKRLLSSGVVVDDDNNRINLPNSPNPLSFMTGCLRKRHTASSHAASRRLGLRNHGMLTMPGAVSCSRIKRMRRPHVHSQQQRNQLAALGHNNTPSSLYPAPSYCYELNNVGTAPNRQLQVAFDSKSVAISHEQNLDVQLTKIYHDNSNNKNKNGSFCDGAFSMYFCEPGKPATASAVPKSYSAMNFGYADDFQHEVAFPTEQFVLGFATEHTRGLSRQNQNCIVEIALRVVGAWLRLKIRKWYGAHEPASFRKYLPLEYVLFKAAEYAGIDFVAPRIKFKLPQVGSLKRLVLDAHWLVATNEAAIAVETSFPLPASIDQ